MLTHQACKLNPCLDCPLGSPTMPSGRGRIDPPQIGKKKKVHASICLYAHPPSLYAQPMPLLSFRLTHYAIWEGKDRPSTDRKRKEKKSTQVIAYMLTHQACMLNPYLKYPLGSSAIPSGRGRIDPPQIKEKKGSPRKQLPICSTTKPVCSTHALTILTCYVIWEGKDRPSTDRKNVNNSLHHRILQHVY